MTTTTDSPQVRRDKEQVVHPPDQTAASSTTIEALTRKYADLRDEARLVNSEIIDGHREMRRWRLDERTAAKARDDVHHLLDELAIDRGMTWAAIARLSGVSVSAVRKWRAGDAPAPDRRLAVARLAAFLDLLEELPVSEPSAWLAMPMVDGYTVTAEDLYLAGGADQLLDFASGQLDLNDILTEFDSDWRTQYRSDFEVVEGGDGSPSIVRRG